MRAARSVRASESEEGRCRAACRFKRARRGSDRVNDRRGTCPSPPLPATQRPGTSGGIRFDGPLAARTAGASRRLRPAFDRWGPEFDRPNSPPCVRCASGGDWRRVLVWCGWPWTRQDRIDRGVRVRCLAGTRWRPIDRSIHPASGTRWIDCEAHQCVRTHHQMSIPPPNHWPAAGRGGGRA